MRSLSVNRSNHAALSRLLFLVLTVSSLLVSLTAKAADSDRYRAEILLFERLVDPNTLNEQMADKPVPTLPTTDAKNLWVEGPDGQVQSDLTLIDAKDLYLEKAAERLTRSGHYKVLMLTGWDDAFPPGYQSPPLLIRIGEQADGHSATEGYLQISRQRYLHVTANLASLKFVEPTLAPEQPDSQTSGVMPDTASDTLPVVAPLADQSGDQRVPQVITWLRENRRMRSQELHYLDSPTLGLLIYFEPLKDQPSTDATSSTATSPAASPGTTSGTTSSGTTPASTGKSSNKAAAGNATTNKTQ